MAVVREPMEITLIPNTRMNKMIVNGIHNGYEIQAVEGYVLHDNRIDSTDYDELDNATIIPRFKLGSTTVPASYDFDNVTNGTFTYTDENGMTVSIPVEMVGMYEFYTLPVDVVPTDQTCEVEIKPEVM